MSVGIPWAAWSCNDPAKHPEWWVFNSMVKALGEQPRIPVQMLYKVAEDRAPGQASDVLLSFSSLAGFDQARFTVVPSNGLSLVDFDGGGEVTREAVNFKVVPLHAGFHHLRVDITVTDNGTDTTGRYLLPLPVKLEHSALRLGFGGERLPKARLPGHNPNR